MDRSRIRPWRHRHDAPVSNGCCGDPSSRHAGMVAYRLRAIAITSPRAAKHQTTAASGEECHARSRTCSAVRLVRAVTGASRAGPGRLPEPHHHVFLPVPGRRRHRHFDAASGAGAAGKLGKPSSSTTVSAPARRSRPTPRPKPARRAPRCFSRRSPRSPSTKPGSSQRLHDTGRTSRRSVSSAPRSSPGWLNPDLGAPTLPRPDQAHRKR